jgi:hypothetical protein
MKRHDVRQRHSSRRGAALTELVLASAPAYGRRVGLRLPAELLPAVRPWLPHWWRDADVEPERTWTISAADEAEYVVAQLELWVAEHAEDLVFVHAGVVAVGGRALLLPGSTHAGKTSLTAALLRSGAAYGSDEYAVLDAEGRVRPYPRPLSIRENGRRIGRTAAELGAATFSDPQPVGAVAVLRYVPGRRYQVELISAATAVLRLFENTICAQSRPEPALDALIAAVHGAQTVEGVRGDADEACRPLSALLG